MLANFEAIRQGALSWISTSTGITTIWANANAPRPNYPYATVNIISGPTPRQSLWNTNLNSAGDTTTRDCLAEMVFSINIFSDSHQPATHAQRYAQLAIGDLQTRTRRDALCAAGLLGVINIPTLNNFDFSDDGNNYITRAQFDVTVVVQAVVTEADTFIETFETRTVVEDQAGNTVDDSTEQTTP